MRVLSLAIFIPLLLTGCGYDRFGSLPPSPPSEMLPNTDLGTLRTLYQEQNIDLPADLVVGGMVTSCDSAGNFYKMIVIQSESVAVGILTGLYDTYAAYKPGQQVVFRADSLRLGIRDGILCIGAPDNTGSGVDYLNSEPLLRRRLVRAEQTDMTDTLRLTIPNVTPALAGRLVRVTGGTFTQGGKQTWSGERTYSEQRGVSLTVYTSEYATFANDLLPEGAVELTGIVTLYRDKVQLKLNSADDARIR